MSRRPDGETTHASRRSPRPDASSFHSRRTVRAPSRRRLRRRALEVDEAELEVRRNGFAFDAVREVDAEERQHDGLHVETEASADVVAEPRRAALHVWIEVRAVAAVKDVFARAVPADEAGVPERDGAECEHAPLRDRDRILDAEERARVAAEAI